MLLAFIIMSQGGTSKETRIEYLMQNQQAFEQLALLLLDLKQQGIKRITFNEIVPNNFADKASTKQQIQQVRTLFKKLNIDYGYFAYGAGDVFFLVTHRFLLSEISQGYSYISPAPLVNYNCKESAVIDCNNEEKYTVHIIKNWYLYRR